MGDETVGRHQSEATAPGRGDTDRAPLIAAECDVEGGEPEVDETVREAG